MRLGIISDTHGNVENSARAIELFQGLQIDILLHCGDIGTSSVVEELTDWPTHFVFGNVDRDEDLLRQAIRDAGQTCHDWFGELELEGRKIAFLHGDDQRLFQSTVAADTYDMVCYGHTHRAESHQVKETLVLNPGALHRANPHTFAVVDLETMTPEYYALSGDRLS